MKKVVMFILILIVFLSLVFPIISSVEINMKSDFAQGETLIAKISGNFVEPPSKENILFYRGGIDVPMEFEIGKIGGDYYIYAMLPENSANYSLEIGEVQYYKGTKITDEKIVKNFSISNATAEFSVEPGFAITSEDFYLSVQNLQESKITIAINSETISGTSEGFLSSIFGGNEIQIDNSTSFELKSGEIKEINFEVGDITENSVKIIKLSSGNLIYEIPVYIFGKEVIKNYSDENFKFGPSEINVSLATDSSVKRIIYLYNLKEELIENITLEISKNLEPYVVLSRYEISEIKPNESVGIEIQIFSGSDENVIDGEVRARTDSEIYAYSSLFLNFIEDFILSNNTEYFNGTEGTKTCLEIEGKICGETENCDGEEESAKDGKCCLGNCIEEEEFPTGKLIGGILIILIVVFLIWFYKARYKGTEKRKIDLLKVGGGK